MNTNTIVQRLWNLCHVLRDDGITYHQYVTELTFLLFLKMEKETENTPSRLGGVRVPEGWRWSDLTSKDGLEQLTFYRKLLIELGQQPGIVGQIYSGAGTALREPRNLAKLVESIDNIDWYSAREEGLGDLYEGLLEKNANEKKSGAGQYFTPRVLIDVMVALTKPQPGETVQDPAAGTGGFLVAADRYVKANSDDHFDLPEQLQFFQRRQAFHGMELVPDTHRLLLMNMMLHGIESDILLGDTLSPAGSTLEKVDVVLTNPRAIA